MLSLLSSQLNNLHVGFNKKSLLIGNTKILLLWQTHQTIDKLIISVYNINKRERNFHFKNINDSDWNIIEDSSGQRIVTLYGIQPMTNKVLISCQRTFKPNPDDDQSTMMMELHNERNSLFNISNDGIDVMEAIVNQRVLQSQQSQVTFQIIPSNGTPKHFVQILKKSHSQYQEFITVSSSIPDNIPCELDPKSRDIYMYQIYELQLSSRSRKKYKVTKFTNPKSFTIHYTKEDLISLYNLAESFRSQRMSNRKCSKSIPVPYLYRNKPTTHPTIVDAEKTGIMAKYIKDNNGDQASSINNNINGLFFSASVSQKTKQAPDFSFFGNYRLIIPPEYILSNLNIYFADFYCQATKRPHYVTIVLTRPNSVEDVYCESRLLKLDIHNNKFLYFDSQYGYRATKACHIEVFYTEDINLVEMRSKAGVQEYIIKNVRGRGQSLKEGIPKYKNCCKCNLPKNTL